MPNPGAIIFFDATKANPYGHVAVVESATVNTVTVIEQNAGSGNGNGIGGNAITRRTVGYTASAGRGKCLGWYEYIGKPTPTPTPTQSPEKPLTLKEIYEREKPGGYVPLFSNHDDPTPATRGDIAIYCELAMIRASKATKRN